MFQVQIIAQVVRPAIKVDLASFAAGLHTEGGGAIKGKLPSCLDILQTFHGEKFETYLHALAECQDKGGRKSCVQSRENWLMKQQLLL